MNIEIQSSSISVTSFDVVFAEIHVKHVSLCFPRSRVPSTYLVSTTYSSSSLRITCSRNVICQRIMSCIIQFPTPALRNISHVLTLSVLNIILRNQCSKAFKFFNMPVLNVHVSHPYSIVDQVYNFNILSRTSILMFLPHNSFFN